MAQSAAPPVLPVHERPGGDTEAIQPAAPPRAQSQEDLRLAEGVERALRATGYAPLRGIQVTAEARLVILAGRVPSYYLKQVAQATALSVLGVDLVRNDLEVGRPG